MAGVEGGVSVGTAVGTAPSLGGFHGAEIGSVPAVTGVLAQATAVAERAWGMSPTSALDAAQAAMYSAAGEAWEATEPVTVLSPQVTAMLAFTGLQAQMHSTEHSQHFDPIPTVQTVPTNSYSVLAEANTVVEEALSRPAVHVLSPFEVSGLISVAAQAQESLTQVASVAPEPEIAMPAVEFSEPSLPEVMTVSVSNLPIEAQVVEAASSPEISIARSEESLIAALHTTVSPELDEPLDSSDGAVAQRVAVLAGELGLKSIESEANNVVERAKKIGIEPTDTLLGDFEEVMQDPTMLKVEQNKRLDSNINTLPTSIGPVKDEKANGTRRDILTGVVDKLGEEIDEGRISGTELARQFVKQAQTNDLAQSEIVRASRVPDGTIRYIANDLTGKEFRTADEAGAAVNEAIATHTAVAVGARRQVSDRAVEKVFEGAVFPTKVLYTS